MKEVEGKFYVIEINDNPNIDAGIEDKILKDRLYDIIMEVFLNKIKFGKWHNIRACTSSRAME